MMGMGMGRMHGPETPAAASARLSELKASLNITAAQEAAWGKYAALVTQQAEVRDAMRTQMQAQMSDPKTAATIDHNAMRETMQKFQLENWTARDAALKELVAVLTPEQKAVADQRLQGWGRHPMAGRMVTK
jgi:Spy/CpxP family protein refolding chaperone